MNLSLFLDNLFSLPMLSFISGWLLPLFSKRFSPPSQLVTGLTALLLFSIGFKGGKGIWLSSFSEEGLLLSLSLLLLLILWGVLQPFLCYVLLKRSTQLDMATLVTISACYGSVSVMTYVAAVTFLDKLSTPHDPLLLAALAIMEVPAIISGLIIYKRAHARHFHYPMSQILLESLSNKSILLLMLGMVLGTLLPSYGAEGFTQLIQSSFLPLLALFLFCMGHAVAKHRRHMREFSWPLLLFGLYMPLIGALFGLGLSRLFQLDIGTGTLVGVLTASASYIAVPAAMKISLPEAKESIYLPLSLGITFPFNVTVGIPLYYKLALHWLE